MATLTIGNRTVTVGDEFLKLSPEDQQKTVDEIEAGLPPLRTDRAVQRGFARTASFGFLDELEGLARAGGAAPDEENPFKALGAIGTGAYRKFTGDPEAQKAYDEQVAQSRELSKGLEEQHPGATLGGQIGGAVALPAASFLKGATWVGRAANAAITGGITGGLTGIGEGEGAAGRAKGGAIGLGTGAVIGAVGSPIAEGAIKLGKAAAAPVYNRLRGVRNPDQEAVRRIGVAGVRDANDPGLSATEYAAEQAAKTPVAAIDRLGTTGRALWRSATNTSPEGRGAAEKLTNDRFATQGARVRDHLTAKYGDLDLDTLETTVRDAAKAANRPAYDLAFRKGAAGIWDDELVNMVKAPVVQDAVKAAITQVENKTAAGAGAARWVGPDRKPTLEFWDQIKRQLDQEISVARRAGRIEDAGVVTDLKNKIVAKLDAAVPEYKVARAGAEGFFNELKALNFSPKTLAKLHTLDAKEKELVRDAYVARFISRLDNQNDRTNLLNRIGASPAARKEMEAVLGKTDADDLRVRLRVESVMDRARTALGNSTTARQLIEAGLAGGATGIYQGDMSSIGSMGSAAIFWLAMRRSASAIGVRVDQNVSRRVAEMLASEDDSVVERGIKMIQSSTGLQRIMEGADNFLAKVAGTQTPGQ